MTDLPYIVIKSLAGRPLVFLIDTGASRSLMNPEIATPSRTRKLAQPLTLKTALNSHQILEEVRYPAFKEFNTSGNFSFLLFKFHNTFDGVIGMDILQQIGAEIDLVRSQLRTTLTHLPICFQNKSNPQLYVLEPGSVKIIPMTVNLQNGTFLTEQKKIAPDLFSSEGLYQATNYISYIEVVNHSDSFKHIDLSTPIVVEEWKQDNVIEFNFFDYVKLQDKPNTNFFKQLHLEHLNTEEYIELKKLCSKFKDIFYDEDTKLTFANTIKHSIPTTDDIPIYNKPFRYGHFERIEVQNQIRKLLDMNIIRDSYSPWSAPVWLVPKKQDKNLKKEWRLVVDFRKLNEKTVKDRYPMPVITDVLDKLGKATYFSALDLASGYYQIEMTAEDMAKTAFSAEGGHYEFTRMPFGLTNAPATFQRVMDNVFKELIGKCCLIYLDDIIIFSSSLQEHMQDQVFSKLTSTNLKLQVKKSEFLRKDIEYLGHVISADGIKPNPNKLTAITNFTLPKTRKEIKSFLGLLGYYRKFIRDFARITKPLTTQLKGKKTVKIDQNFIDTFEICKTLLCNDPILQYPDFSKQFILTTDASNVALGAVLSQGSLGSDKPVSFASRTLNETEQNYSTVEKEMLAIIWAIKYFRPYLFGKKIQNCYGTSTPDLVNEF